MARKLAPVKADRVPAPASGRYPDARSFLHALQDRICSELEFLDGSGSFRQDLWSYSSGAGGGRTRILEDGAVLEKGGVNVSAIEGQFSEEFMREQRFGSRPFRATGISLVLHPVNPHVPTLHANFRFITCGERDAWFAGGVDMTPYYPYDEDISAFHAHLKALCDRHGQDFYARFKSACDTYFYLPHRGETRGVGGLFFDELREPFELHEALWRDLAEGCLKAWTQIARRRRDTPYGERERQWQEVRRGRYVEFNLMYDRGTAFGLKTGGRVESILMSLPPRVRWHYQFTPEPGSPEARLADYLRPRDWLGEPGGPGK